MRQVQVIPVPGFRLYGAMVAKEIELSRKNRGTFRRSAKREHNRARWSHSNFKGWIKLKRGMGEIVQIEVRSKAGGAEWNLLLAILGFVDRHFADDIRAMNIQF
jgi:hypothetical protein